MSKTLIVAGDISKGYGDFIAIDQDKEVLLPLFQLDDNAPGHRAMTTQLQQLKERYAPHRILFVVESTGGLEDNWLRLVNQAPLVDFVGGYRINPKLTHHEYRVQQRNSISDRVSSLTIAHHVAKNLEQFCTVPFSGRPDYAPACRLIRHLVSLEQQCCQHKNSLQQLLYQYLPSLVPLLPKAWPRYFLRILLIYGSKRSIQKAAIQRFKQVSHVPQGKADQIQQALRNGIDPNQTPPLVVATIKSKAQQILSLQEQIKELQSLLCREAPIDPKQRELLCSIRGMGQVTATILLCFIEDVNRFEKARAMAAFFGVPPRIKNSGDGKVSVGMSKQGNPLVRRELYLLAFRTLSLEPYLRSIYAKFRRQGRVHDAAIGVLMHKLLRIIYGILSSGKRFDPGLDQLNQIDARSQSEQKTTQTTRKDEQQRQHKRRLQTTNETAPLSARQRRQRKKDQEFQAAEKTESAESS